MPANQAKQPRSRSVRPVKGRRPSPSSGSKQGRGRPKTGSETLIDPSAKLGPQLRLTVQMVLVARRWRSLLDERLRPLGQSSARMEAMSTISFAPPFSQQIELAKRLGVEGATFTRMLDSLEAEGLVERLADPSDRRAKHIRLTKEGEVALAEITAVAEKLRAHLLEGFPPSSIDKANEFLAQILAHLTGNFPPTDGGRD